MKLEIFVLCVVVLSTSCAISKQKRRSVPKNNRKLAGFDFGGGRGMGLGSGMNMGMGINSGFGGDMSMGMNSGFGGDMSMDFGNSSNDLDDSCKLSSGDQKRSDARREYSPANQQVQAEVQQTAPADCALD